MPESTPEWSEEYDVIVVGSGAGGVCGTYTAAREGLSVLMVEASDKFGGTTSYSGGGGVWYPCNPVVQRAGVDDTIEDALTYYRAVVGDRTPADLQETYVRGGAPLLAYLETDEHLKFQTLPWPDYFGKAPGARLDGMRHVMPSPLRVSKAPEFKDLVRGPLDVDRHGTDTPDDYFIGGRALIARFLTAIAQYPNATTRLRSPLVDLVVDRGVVVGAIVETDGRRTAIRARLGVVLASGGFEGNDAMRGEFGVPGAARDTMGPPTNQGLAHRAGIAAGADTDLMDQAWWSPGLTHPDGRSAFALWFTGGIFVNQDGERFVNESAAYDRLGREVLAQIDDGTVTLPFWMIYDDADDGVPPVKAPNVSFFPTQDYHDAGLWHTADTLEELAAKIGVPAEKLTATVARYNEHVATGVDPDFDRGGEAYDRAFSGGQSPMVAVERGPFHAAAFGLSDLGTKGGLRTGNAGNVLRADGTTITGLYAAGNTMAAPSGTVYPGGGNPIGTSMLFAHLAVRDLLAQD
ncbi:FAD-binding protein [Gordonia aichiensis]|uniref:FAD-binding protein n=1 Tax=Gordonia aichiensis TaxID=36820 RepID=UPI003262F581